MTLRPNIVLTERHVSGIALEHFLREDVVVVSDVKHSVLERLSRLTGAHILPSIESLTTADRSDRTDRSDRSTRSVSKVLGTCELFRVQVHREANGMLFAYRRGLHFLVFWSTLLYSIDKLCYNHVTRLSQNFAYFLRFAEANILYTLNFLNLFLSFR